MQGPDATRRALLAALAAGIAAPALGRDAPRRVTVIGRPADDYDWLRPLLAERGYVEGVNLQMLVFQAEGPAFQAAAQKAVASRPDLLITGGVVRVKQLMALTSTIPIICTLGSDAVGAGLANSLSRPGRNVTGFSIEVRDIAPITLRLLKSMRPGLKRMVLVLPTGPLTLNEGGLRPFAEAARAEGLSWEPRIAASAAQFEQAVAGSPGEQTAAFLSGGAGPDASALLAVLNEKRVATLAGLDMDWVDAGALMGYVRNIPDKGRRLASLIDKILRGADPGTIPFEVGERSEFHLNVKTARLIGVTVPQEVLLRATRVIA
jgi:putative ABC transport system substrate-binding protein